MNFSLSPHQRGACLLAFVLEEDRQDRAWRLIEVRRETETKDTPLPRSPGHTVLMCCCLFCCGGEAAAMPVSEALLSAKFFGEGGLFSQTARS